MDSQWHWTRRATFDEQNKAKAGRNSQLSCDVDHADECSNGWCWGSRVSSHAVLNAVCTLVWIRCTWGFLTPCMHNCCVPGFSGGEERTATRQTLATCALTGHFNKLLNISCARKHITHRVWWSQHLNFRQLADVHVNKTTISMYNFMMSGISEHCVCVCQCAHVQFAHWKYAEQMCRAEALGCCQLLGSRVDMCLQVHNTPHYMPNTIPPLQQACPAIAYKPHALAHSLTYSIIASTVKYSRYK